MIEVLFAFYRQEDIRLQLGDKLGDTTLQLGDKLVDSPLRVSVSAMQPCPYFFISLPLLRE